MNRLDSIRSQVQEMIMSIDSEIRRQEAYDQLYGVSSFALMLALKRRENEELAAIAGLFHNYYYCKTGINDFSGPNSAEAARPLLRDLNLFTKVEQHVILRAIFHHGDRSMTHGPVEEIVKDAYVLQLFFQNTCSISSQQDS